MAKDLQPKPSLPDRVTLAAFFLLALVGGANAVAVRFSNSGLPPFWGAGTRFALAALIFWAIILARGTPLPKGRALIGAFALWRPELRSQLRILVLGAKNQDGLAHLCIVVCLA